MKNIVIITYGNWEYATAIEIKPSDKLFGDFQDDWMESRKKCQEKDYWQTEDIINAMREKGWNIEPTNNLMVRLDI